MTNMQKLILQLQAEVDKLNHTCIQLVDEHNSKQKHIDVSKDKSISVSIES